MLMAIADTSSIEPRANLSGRNRKSIPGTHVGIQTDAPCTTTNNVCCMTSSCC